MADQNITELPVKTSSGMTSSDYMLGIDSAEGYQMLIKDLGDYIIRNVQVNTIAGANQTLKSALDTLNSKTNVLYNTPVAGSDAATFLKNYLTHVTIPSDYTAVTFGGSWENVGYVTGIIRKVTGTGFNGIMKVSLSTASGSKEYSFWSWNGTDVYADQIPTRAEVDTINSNSLFYRSPAVTSITSNTDLWNMGTGIYLISLSSTSEYIPNRWGILVVFSCMTDAAYFYITTYGESYLRIAYNLKSGTPAWRYDWKRIDNS